MNCKLAPGYYCDDDKKTKVSAKCGDGIVTAGEECDNGNKEGCVNCKLVAGYYCEDDKKTKVKARCGDGIVTAGEECDNGNK